MKLKTYTASTMAQALAQVRKDLGTDAMILHTRSFRTGSWLGFGGKPMVEITASSPQPTKPRKSRRVKQVPVAQLVTAQTGIQGHEINPEIVVQRSRVRQPAAAQAQQLEAPIDDRAALLQGLMGSKHSPIRDRRIDSFGSQEHEDSIERTEPTRSQSARPEPARPEPVRSELRQEEFQATTFRSINPIELDEGTGFVLVETVDQETTVQETTVQETVVQEITEPETVAPQFERAEPVPLMPQGSDEVFEIAPQKQEIKSEPLENEEAARTPVAKETKIYETVVAQSSPESQALQTQIDSLQKMMGQVLDTTRRTAVAVNKTNADSVLPPVEMSQPLHAIYSDMIDNDVSIELADRFIGAVRDRLDPDELNDGAVIRYALLREIESSIEIVSDSLLTKTSAADRATDGTTDGATKVRPHVIALIGPTGVGKTTTVAKIAATAKLRHGKRVALITSDTYRIAAVDQLKTYASIIGLDFQIANSPQELETVIDSLEDVDLVVIDTAGRSQNNHARLDELGQLISAANPDETHLVLSATVGENVLRKTAERFMELGPDRCILTKIDEAVTTGMIAGISDKIGLPLSFVTVGQEVPDDILPARAERLARAVLDGPAAVVPSL